MKYFAVFGDPISHSLSPQIHEAFAQQFAIALRYERIRVSSGELKTNIESFRQQGGTGANITLPLKQEAFTLCEQLSARALEAQAVNTIGWNNKGELWGDNTDGEGFVRDLTNNHQLSLSHKRILLLGAGGAAAGILAPILSYAPTLVVVNRDLSRVQRLVAHYPQVKVMTYAMLTTADEAPFDYVVNATSASLTENLPPVLPLYIHDACCIDLAYRTAGLTPFLQWAKSLQASHVLDGLGMLVEQAAIGFALWHGQKPLTAPVLQRLRQSI